VVLTVVGGWVGASLVDRLLTFAGGKVPAIVPLAVWFGEVLFNGYVAAALAGALFVGFGPNLWATIRKAGPASIVGIVLSLAIYAGVSWLGYEFGTWITSIMFDAPTPFHPPHWATRNSDGSLRDFEKMAPWQLERRFIDKTDIAAKTQFAPEIGKWMALTAPVVNIESGWGGADGLTVTIGATGGRTAVLHFDGKWSKKISPLNKGDRIYAVCRLSGAASTSVFLDSCEMTPPP
jgi:hypothetical protein